MQKKNKIYNRIVIFSIFILLTILSFLKQYIFINLNYIRDYVIRGYNNYANSEFQFLTDYSVNQIVLIKWGGMFTLFSIIGFINWYVFYKKLDKGSHWGARIYLGMFILAAIIYTIGLIIGDSLWGYNKAHFIVEIGVSPLPFLLLIILTTFMSGQNIEKNR